MRSAHHSFVRALIFAFLAAAPLSAQVSDALRDRVATLVGRLDSEKPEVRDEAEKTLKELGPKILPLLEDDPKASAERKTRIARLKESLAKVEEPANLGASRITLQAKGIRFTEAIQKLQAMSGNTITDLREQAGGDVANPALDLDLKDVPFFQALDEVAKKANVTPNFFTGDGTIGLMEGAPAAAAAAAPMVVYGGPFRIQFREITLVRDFATGTNAANAMLEVAWEPRLRPMLMTIKAEGMDVTDDKAKKVAAMVMEESDETVLRADSPVIEVNVNLAAPERTATEFSSFKIKGEVTVPASQKLFRFKNLTAKNDAQTQGDIKVTLVGMEVDEQVWKVGVQAEYPGGGPAFESYRQGLFNNRIWLQKSDGAKFELNGGFNNTGTDGGKLAFEYLFVDVPGKPSEYGLVYETPSKVVTIPLEFEFKKVPLP